MYSYFVFELVFSGRFSYYSQELPLSNQIKVTRYDGNLKESIAYLF